MTDETNSQLLDEIEGKNGWRISLSSCNKDKQTTQKLIDKFNQPK